MAGSNIGDEINDLVWRDRAHDPQFERPLFRELPRQALRQPRVVVNRLKMWTDHVAKIREVCRFAQPVEEQPSKLLLEKLDSARQGGLRHIASFGCAREIQLLRHRKKITNLMHF